MATAAGHLRQRQRRMSMKLLRAERLAKYCFYILMRGFLQLRRLLKQLHRPK